jgi:adenylate kinase family enzyme
MLKRVAVVGTSCSGKTTFAKDLAACLDAPHVELDAVFWGPDWRPAPDDEFRFAVSEALSGDRWVVDGNYSKVRDIIWPPATCVVWLNYPFRTVFRRALSRTTRRVFRREEIFSGNRETFRSAFLIRESILWWVITTHRKNKRRYGQLLDGSTFPHLRVVELRRSREAAEFLTAVRATDALLP